MVSSLKMQELTNILIWENIIGGGYEKEDFFSHNETTQVQQRVKKKK